MDTTKCTDRHAQTKECVNRFCIVCHTLAPPTLTGSSVLFVMFRISSAKIIPATSLSCMRGGDEVGMLRSRQSVSMNVQLCMYVCRHVQADGARVRLAHRFGEACDRQNIAF